jgi:hypothetical protein
MHSADKPQCSMDKLVVDDKTLSNFKEWNLFRIVPV